MSNLKVITNFQTNHKVKCKKRHICPKKNKIEA